MKKSFLSFYSLLLLNISLNAQSHSDLSERLRNHVSILASDTLQGRGLGTEGTEKARTYIVQQFSEAGIQPLKEFDKDYLQPFSFRQSAAWIPAINIVGVIPGSDPLLKNEYILIGAHYDHMGFEKDDDQAKIIYPGADDNASGIAMIIELGRYFSSNPHLLKRSLLIVAFDAEESGLLGSRHFTEYSPITLSDIKLMFSFDMVGMLKANKGLDLRGIGALESGESMAKQIARRYELNLRNTDATIQRRTDTYPFGQKGIPAVHVFTGTKSPYHKPEDQYHLLDYQGMVSIHTYMSDFLAELSAMHELNPTGSFETYVEKNIERTRPKVSAGISLHVGSGFHSYVNEYYRANSAFSAASGIFVQIPVTRLFTLQPEILYDLNKSKAEGGDFSRHSAALPLNIQFGTPRVSDGNIRFYAFTGPYLRYSFMGRSGGDKLDLQGENQQEWGYSMGLALDIFMFSVGFTHRKALTKFEINQENTIINNNNYFSVGYKF